MSFLYLGERLAIETILDRFRDDFIDSLRQGRLGTPLRLFPFIPRPILGIGTRPRQSTSYLYSLGISELKFQKSESLQKAVFVSRQIKAPGQVGEVTLSAQASHIELSKVGYNTGRASSIEYSITASSNPVNERDWKPILPVGEKEVIGERLFPGQDGWAFLRFPANSMKPIIVYRNRVKYDIQFPASANTGVVDRLQVPMTAGLRGSVLTVDYTPVGDVYRVVPPSGGELILSAAGSGAGEVFSSVGPSQSLVLSELPYIDEERMKASTYNFMEGMEPYQPVTVFIAGVPAINLTNYLGGPETPLNDPDLSPSSVYYVQRDDVLVFNKIVTQPLRVHYQYLPATLRFRAIVRSNHPNDLVTPQLDLVQLCCKIIKGFRVAFPGTAGPGTLAPGIEFDTGGTGAELPSVVVTGTQEPA